MKLTQIFVGSILIGGLLILGGERAEAGIAVSWSTPSGFVRADGVTPLLQSGSAMVQLVLSLDDVVDPPDIGGAPTGNDVLLDQKIMTAAQASQYGQHFSAVYYSSFMPGWVYIRVYDTGTGEGSIPVGTPYYDGPLVSLIDSYSPVLPNQEISEGPFAGGTSQNGMGHYVLDLNVGGLTTPDPYLDITNANQAVANTVSNLTIGGVSSNLIGQILWTNSLNGANGSLAAASSWSFSSILAVGTNVITTSGRGGSITVTTQAMDRGADSVYSNGWAIGDNGGTGFGPWQLTTTIADPNRNGHFTATDTNYTSIGVPAWGLYANLNNLADASRSLSSPLATNQVLSFSFENGLIDVAGSCGIELLNNATQSLFTFSISGSELFYRRGTNLTDVGITTNGIGLEFRLSSPTNYTITIAPQGAAIRVYQGALTPQSNSTITTFRVWNYTAGETSTHDVFVNNLQILTETLQAGAPVSDTVTMIRSPAPLLDVTNGNAQVRYSESTATIGGTIGNGVTGQLRWTNDLTGASATVAAANPFTIAGLALNVGANIISVRGTNLYGDSASDSVTITRGGVGTDLPLVDITNANQTVANAVSNLVIGGTANVHVLGQITWSNSLGGSGSFAAATNWSFSLPLMVGTNTITVRGSNLWSEAATEVVVIIRSAPVVLTPTLDITNANQTVANSVSNLTIGGVSSNLTGQIRWTNQLNGAAGSFAVTSSWSFASPLAMGTNLINVSGTNGAGASASDSVTIIRAPAPLLDITNAPASVRYSVTSIAVGGTIGNEVTGQLRWTNNLTGASGLGSAVNPFSITGMALNVGANVITVRGTNLYGDAASDSVTITRGGIGTDLPLVDITNANQTVANAVSNLVIDGTANVHVLGQITWSNSLGGSGTFAAATNWSFSAPLAVGENMISVAGTNAWGERSTDAVAIVRSAAVLSNSMVLIPAGSFMMGQATNIGEPYLFAATPQHPVFVSAFHMDQYEVTKALWDEVRAYALSNGYGFDGTGLGKAADHPVHTINWYDAVKWCNARSQKDGLTPVYYTDAGYTTLYKTGRVAPYANWTANGYRLPTEAEWEKAARGGASNAYFPWTDYTNRISHAKANYNGSGSGLDLSSGYHPSFATGGTPYTSPVGSFAPNGYGLYDMAGNVWEWNWDYIDFSYYSVSSGIDPRGPDAPSERVYRGGSWNSAGDVTRVANRNASYCPCATGGYDSGGFRCVRGSILLLDITNVNQSVANSVSNLTIGGVSSNLVGQIRWTNQFNGAAGSFAVASSWSFTAPLAMGTNVIVVSGTNGAGQAASDSVIVVRATAVDPDPGNVWTNLAAGVSGLAGRVFDIGFTTNGHLLAAGDYSSPASHVALWSGTSWSSIGNLSHGSDAVVRDQNGNMVVGGAFTTAGGVSAIRIAKWNGASWTNFGSGLNGDVIDLLFDGHSNIYVAGTFSTAGGVGAANVARWNGTSWSALGSGVGGVARALALDGAGNLYVGGDFTNAGSVAARRIAMWNGVVWTNLGSGMNDYVHGLKFDGAGRLYAVGGFTNAGGVAARYVARWDGVAWTNLGIGLSASAIGITVDGSDNVYVGGNFTNAGGVAARYVAKWNGSTWTNMGQGMNGIVYVLAIDAQGYLYAGGGFTQADGRTANGIARWNKPVPMNPPPYWTSIPVTKATVGKRYVYRLGAVDPEDEPITFGATGLPSWLQLTRGSGQISGTNIITTIIGTGAATFSGDGGPATNAAMRWPHSIIVDADGGIIVSDHENHRIRRVHTNGVITTIAGNGSTTYNSDGIAATNAGLYYPVGLELDAEGRVLIADSYHYRVRRIETNGLISTVAGTGINGYAGDGGSATNARLSSVLDVAYDNAGNLFIADAWNNRIRKVDVNGIISTVAGNGGSGFNGNNLPATNATMNGPIGVSVDRNGVIYIADHWNHRVRAIGLDGVMRTVAGNGTAGYNGDGIAATNASLYYPYDVTFDDNGNIYIADDENNRIRMVDANGIISTVAGRGVFAFGGDGGAATNARIAYPTDVEFDREGRLLICDAGNHRIRRIEGESSGWMLTGTPGPADVGSVGVTVTVSDGISTVPQNFLIQVGQLVTPTNLSANGISVSAISLAWTDNNTDETAYVLERRASTNAVWTILATLPAGSASFMDSGLASGQTYYYRIWASNQDGFSAPSVPVSATTLSIPSAPWQLTAVAAATNRIQLSWNDTASNESGFELQRKTGMVGSWAVVASLPADTQSHADSGLSANTLYIYRLRATNAVGVSAFSGEASASTLPMPADPDCSYALRVTATNLTIDGSILALPATVADQALIGGTLGVQQSSPRGIGSVQRVVMGFRTTSGQSVGTPREVSLLYGVPGCPGLDLPAVPVPGDLRAPAEAGTYRLWVEAYVTPLNPVISFRSQTRTNASALAWMLGTCTVQPRPEGVVEVRVLGVQGMMGQPVTVPVLLSSTGGVNTAAFSLTYDPAILTRPRVQTGVDAAAAWVMANTSVIGRVGVLVMMPGDESLESGTKNLVQVVFDPLAAGASAVTFADTPTARSVAFVDPEVVLSASWVGDQVTIMQPGYEGDLAPRPGGDLLVTDADVVLMQLIVAGMEPVANSNEYRKADCSPRATSGNGRIDVADLRQVMRFRTGQDPLAAAGGPWSATNGLLARLSGSTYQPPMVVPYGESDRVLYLPDTSAARGETFWLPVMLAAQGNESTLGFSVEFDPDRLTYLDVRTVGAATNAILVPSLESITSGRAGFALAMPGSTVWLAGAGSVLEIGFSAAAGAGTVTTTVLFADNPVPRGCADINAVALSSSYTGAVVTLTAEDAPGAPDAPLDVAASAVSTSQVNLTWTDFSFDETGFRVWRRQGAEPWTVVMTMPPDAESYADGGLAARTEYRYMVEAYNGDGSGFSAETQALTWDRVTMWRLATFGTTLNQGDTADAGDWDYDGVPNLVEYTLGTSATNEYTNPDVLTMQVQNGVTIGTNRFLTATYELTPDAAPGMDVVIQLNTNLMSTWWNGMVPLDETISNGTRRVRVRSEQPLGMRLQEYIRMNVGPSE